MCRLVGSLAGKLRHPSSTWLTNTSYASNFIASCSFYIHYYTAKNIRQAPGDALFQNLGLVGSAPPSKLSLFQASTAANPAHTFLSATPEAMLTS